MVARWLAHRDRGHRGGHLRGHGGAHGGGTVALATTLMVETCLADTLSKAYKVALCARV